MGRMLLAIVSLTLPSAALAQATPIQEVASAQPPQRIRSVTLTGNQPCPVAQGDEVVVCSRIAPGDQFRVPPALRHEGAELQAQNQSWVNRAATIDQVGRVAGGLPDTCSPVGSGGQTGCTQQILRDYAAERAAARRSGTP